MSRSWRNKIARRVWVGNPPVFGGDYHGNKGGTAKVQKGIIKDFLHGTNGRENKMDWLPPYFQFPPKAYTGRGGVGAVEKWKTAASLFTAE
jgi:hypothetical protein